MRQYTDIEWHVLLKTDGGYVFNLGVWAPTFIIARSKAKKLSKGCKVIALNEIKPKEI